MEGLASCCGNKPGVSDLVKASRGFGHGCLSRSSGGVTYGAALVDDEEGSLESRTLDQRWC